MKHFLLLLLFVSFSAFAQKPPSKPIRLIARFIDYKCDKLCAATYEVLKIIEDDNYAVQDTIVVGFSNIKEYITKDNMGTYVTLTLERYTECTTISNYYILPDYNFKHNVITIADLSLLPKKKVIYTIQKPCETASAWFGSFVMNPRWVDQFITQAEKDAITTDVATIRFNLKSSSLISSYHISNKTTIMQSQTLANKVAMQLFTFNQTSLSPVFGCSETMQGEVSITINFEVKSI